MPKPVRTNCYLDGQEHPLLMKMAREQGISKNLVLRLGFRILAGLPVPPYALQMMEDNRETGSGTTR